MFILKSVKSAKNDAWSVLILACFCFTRPNSVTFISAYVTVYSQLTSNDILDFFSHASHVLLGSSFIPSIRMLFLQDLSSNSINFADTSSAFNRSSSMALNSVFKFFLFFPGIVPHQFFLCVNSKLAVK